uniref:GIY-YIG domain-containing protein n=1 Tax=Rhodopseudomonas palustris (strain DX-1) TaxID=652103 RepID=E6VQ27_RHOPX
MAFIYGLYSCKDGVIRYVGETTRTCQQRFEEHCKPLPIRGLYYPESRVWEWVRGQWIEGYPVKWICLEECAAGDRGERERVWAARFPGLINVRKYNCWIADRARLIKPPSLPEVRRVLRGHYFNIYGRRGIHYEIGQDRFYVTSYHRGCLEYVSGDEPVGGGPAIYFSDFRRAEAARELHRKYRRNLIILPDQTPSESR